MWLINNADVLVDVAEDLVEGCLKRGFQRPDAAPVAPLPHVQEGEVRKVKSWDPAKRTGKLCAVMCVYNEADFIEYALRGIYEHADRILVLINVHPWAGTVADYPPDNTLEIVEAFPDPDHKIDLMVGDWFDGNHGGQLAQRSYGFSVLDPGDWMWFVDADEFIPPECIAYTKGFLRQTKSDTVSCYFYTLFQDLRLVGWTEWMPRFHRVLPEAKFIGVGGAVDGAGKPYEVGRLDRNRFYVLHAGYVKRDVDVWDKVRRYQQRSERGDFYPGFSADAWWRSSWMACRQGEVRRSVHPTSKYGGVVNGAEGPFPLPVGMTQEMMDHPFFVRGDGSVSVIVVTYESSRPLKRMLDDFCETVIGLRRIQFIVIDNGSKDVELTESLVMNLPVLGVQSVRMVRNPENRKFTAAVNQGLRVSRGEFILLLNPDCEFPNVGWLDRMLMDLTNTPNAGICGCKMLQRDGLIHHVGGGIRAGDPEGHFHIAYRNQDDGSYDQVRAVEWVTGACFLFTREVFVALGPLDDRHPHFKSDNKYCAAALRAGFGVICSPATIVHDAGRSVQPPLELEAERVVA